MEAEGLAFQYAKRLTKSTIEHILKNPIYYGDFLWNGKLYHGSHLAIISRDLWDQTQEAFRKTNRPKQTKREFPFIGMLTCAFCGCAITAELKKGKYIYYHCTGNHGACMKPTVGSVSPTTITLTTAPKLRGWGCRGGGARAQVCRSEVVILGRQGVGWARHHPRYVGGKDRAMPWIRWASLGKPPETELGRPFAQRNQDGRLEVFAIGLGEIFNISQVSPNGGWRERWLNKGRPSSNVGIKSHVVGRNADGRLEIFAVGDDNALWQKWQVAPNNGWSDWKTLGTPARATSLNRPVHRREKSGWQTRSIRRRE